MVSTKAFPPAVSESSRPELSHIVTEDKTAPPAAEETLRPDVSHIVTEDDTPVDNIFSEKQMRLLTEPLYSSWNPGRKFLAAANVGLFNAVNEPPIVPDVFLSLDVSPHEDWWAKHHRSYFVWEFGKVPELVLEIVSNREGGEGDRKLREYGRIGVTYYVIYDPAGHIQDRALACYTLRGQEYVALAPARFEDLGLSLVQWEGVFEGRQESWLRWADFASGELILTGTERADRKAQLLDRERQRANHQAQLLDHQAQLLDQQAQLLDQQAQLLDEERQRADQQEQRAEEERQRTEEQRQRTEEQRRRTDALAKKLRSLGVDPDDDGRER